LRIAKHIRQCGFPRIHNLKRPVAAKWFAFPSLRVHESRVLGGTGCDVGRHGLSTHYSVQTRLLPRGNRISPVAPYGSPPWLEAISHARTAPGVLLSPGCGLMFSRDRCDVGSSDYHHLELRRGRKGWDLVESMRRPPSRGYLCSVYTSFITSRSADAEASANFWCRLAYSESRSCVCPWIWWHLGKTAPP